MQLPSESQQLPENEENILLEQGRRIRALHEIISRPDLSFDQQIDETLRLGCQLLGTEIGKVGRQDPENNVSEFLNTIVMSDLPVKRGTLLPLDKTFCQVTFSSPETIAISHVSESEFKDHPAAEFLGMQSYIGCSINVHGKKFGTVNFSNRTPVARPFTECDKDMVNLIGSWISVMMERQLEAEVLKKSKEAADAANQAKSTFLANMSHEIRTPLTSIIGFAESALDTDLTLDECVSAMKAVRKSSEHLLNLINDVLDFSKIEAGELFVEKCETNPIQLVAEVESIIAGHARKKNLDFTIEYEYPLPETILSDPLRLKQILLNLCNNAIKFTDTGSIQMILKYDTDQDILTFAIKDTGIGITPEQAKKLFKPFKQADASISRRFGGTGLGLFLSKRLAELLDSELIVKSMPDEGSTFSLSLSQAQAEVNSKNLIHDSQDVGSSGQYPQPEFPETKLSGEVLLVEDNDLNQRLIKGILEKMGATVTVADNGAVAVNLAQQHDFDLIYMDMQMPLMSGTDAVRILRSKNYAGPIVMLTANATYEDRMACKDAGSDDYLTKPIYRQKLYETTARYLKSV